MKKKIILTEAERKALIIEKEKAIIKSFAKTFNKIKRIDENEVDGDDYEQASRSVEYGIDPYQEQPSLFDDRDAGLLEFHIPEWALSSLINGDDSGLEDDDIRKLEAFTSRVVSKYGNANFMLGDIEGEDNLGFKHSNDIDNLGSNVYRLFLKPSK